MTTIVRAIPVTEPVMVPSYVVYSLRQKYERLKANHPDFYPMSFDEWVSERLKDVAYGTGEDTSEWDVMKVRR